MSNDGQDNKNVNNYQVQLNNNNSNNNQDQKENTSINNDTLTPEAFTSPSDANIAFEQNAAQVKSTFDAVLGAEVTSSDPVEVNSKDDNNKQEQLSLDTNIGDTQDKEASINANTEATSKKEDGQSTKVNVAEKENAVQGDNIPNEVKEQVIANNASTEPDKQNADSIDKDLNQLLSRIEKGEPTQKLEDAQVKNVLNSIKAQMTSIKTPADFGRLSNALVTLAASTNNPELRKKIQSMKASVDSKAKTAEQNIRNDVTSDNLEAQESIAQTEHKANIAKYTAIKADFHKKLDEDLELLDAAIDPNRATPEQSRILEDDLTDEEREELKIKTQLKKEGFAYVYAIKENAEKEIAQNNKKITSIDERLKTTKDDNHRQSLEAEKKQYIKTKEERQKELDDHVKDELAKRDKEREKLTEFTKLKERVEKYPTTAKRFVREHFELHAAEYDKNPDRTAINELHAMVRKVGLAEKLTDEIANIIVHNEGYPHHIEIMEIEKMDKTEEQKLIKSIEPVLKLGQLNPSNTPNNPKKGQYRKI